MGVHVLQHGNRSRLDPRVPPTREMDKGVGISLPVYPSITPAFPLFSLFSLPPPLSLCVCVRVRVRISPPEHNPSHGDCNLQNLTEL